MLLFNAYLNYVASFESLHQILYEELRRHEHNYSGIWSKYVHVCHLRGHNSAIMTWIEILSPLCHAQCISELCCMFQIPASKKLLEGVQCDMVKICMSFKGT